MQEIYTEVEFLSFSDRVAGLPENDERDLFRSDLKRHIRERFTARGDLMFAGAQPMAQRLERLASFLLKNGYTG